MSHVSAADLAPGEQFPFDSEALHKLEAMRGVEVVGWLEPEPDYHMPGYVFIAPSDPIGFRDERRQNAFVGKIGEETGLLHGKQGHHTNDAWFSHGELHPATLQDPQTRVNVMLYPGRPLAQLALDDQLRHQLAAKYHAQHNPQRMTGFESPLLYRMRETDAPRYYDIKNEGYGEWTHVRNWLGELAIDLGYKLGL